MHAQKKSDAKSTDGRDFTGSNCTSTVWLRRKSGSFISLVAQGRTEPVNGSSNCKG